jgi:nitroimidazol reductase NimA-like FMN-containing flavoprotein (pyridoxamine 5'-phosphate oxidase superfamily)
MSEKTISKTMKRIKPSAFRNIPATTTKGSVSVPARLKRLDRTQRHAVLATTGRSGPLTSLVAFALTRDGKGIVFATPRATTKYRNMLKDSRVALLIDSRENSGKDYLQAEAITVFGRAREVGRGRRWTKLATLLEHRHLALGPFIAAPTTALMFVTITRCVHVGGFQSMTVWKPS